MMRQVAPLDYHWIVARTQTIVQLTDELLVELDARRVREGRSRSELIRAAIEMYLAGGREAELDRLLVDGYTRIPPDEDLGASWAAGASIEAEPWRNAQL
jgi:Arc/MetJ-type ribon-helix-helix transcriptional regulator